MRLINRRPGRGGKVLLGALPFAAILAAYAAGSAARRAANPADKLLPSFEDLVASLERLALQADRRTGEYVLWADTAASLARLWLGLAIAAALALVLGIAIGLIPRIRAALAPAVAVISMVPPLAILPILFIVFGLGEVAKVALIVIGIAPVMVRDLANRTIAIPEELIVKAQTLGAGTWQIVTRVALPSVLPQLLVAMRLALGPAWLFLIASEAIAATGGLGYRIFLVRRYLAMDDILVYVAWITLLAFVIDRALRALSRGAFAWAHAGGETL